MGVTNIIEMLKETFVLRFLLRRFFLCLRFGRRLWRALNSE